MNKFIFSFSTVFFLIAANVAHGTPSFNCANSSTNVEKLICASEKLSKLDVDLSALYKDAIKDISQYDEVKRSQIDWMNSRNKCNDEDCLSRTYFLRIDQLRSLENAKSQSEQGASKYQPVGENRTVKFTLTSGDSYPICKPLVDMLNATNYTEYPSCSRKILPEFNMFKKIEWVEITNKVAMKEIILRVRERELLYMRSLVKSSLEDYVREDLQLIAEDKLKLYEYVMDIDGDAVDDHLYKSVKSVPSLKDYNLCALLSYYYMDASTITLERAKTLKRNPFFEFNLSGNNDLFLFESKIFSSNWSVGSGKNVPSLEVYGNKKMCSISVN